MEKEKNNLIKVQKLNFSLLVINIKLKKMTLDISDVTLKYKNALKEPVKKRFTTRLSSSKKINWDKKTCIRSSLQWTNCIVDAWHLHYE